MRNRIIVNKIPENIKSELLKLIYDSPEYFFVSDDFWYVLYILEGERRGN